MTYNIIYSSRTGNTALLAKTIAQALPAQDCQYTGAPGDKIPEAELFLIGFWTDKGTCDEQTAQLLSTLKNQKIFLFGTAGFGGSNEYYSRILSRMKELLDPTCEVVGSYMCQGKMPDVVRQRYEAMLAQDPQDKKIQAMLENFQRALSHPDAQDLQKLTQIIDALNS